jgi:hypothetical protein
MADVPSLLASALLLTATPPHEIHGVSTRTPTGGRRTRYSSAEQLQILGATERDVEDFMELLAPYHPEFSVTRAKSGDPRDWVKSKGRLSIERVVRHLLGDRIPGRPPIWVAPWGSRWTRWVGLDVDCRGDIRDFQNRYDRALGTMISLGFPRESLLISDTPSGGVHLRGFLASTIPLPDVQRLFGLVEMINVPGQIEVFPAAQQGLRLPFGKLPGRELDPEAWKQFVQLHRERQIYTPKVDLVFKRAVSQHKRLLAKAERAQRSPDPSPIAKVLGPPRHKTAVRPGKNDSPRELTVEIAPIQNVSDAIALYEAGIPGPGMRVAMSKQLAWHFIHVNRLPVSDAIAKLNEWVYRTGKGRSKDVEGDLQTGARRVAEQNAELVNWMAATPTTGSKGRTQRLYPEEVAWIVERLGARQPDFAGTLAFACRALEFAKRYGEPTDEGWQAAMAAKGIFRRWPGCSGMRYKPPLDAAISAGVLLCTGEAIRSRNGSGHARIYSVRVSPDLDRRSKGLKEHPFAVDEAVEYGHLLARAVGARLGVKNDTYWNVPPKEIRDSKEGNNNGKGKQILDVEATNADHGDISILDQLREKQRRPISYRLKYGDDGRLVRGFTPDPPSQADEIDDFDREDPDDEGGWNDEAVDADSLEDASEDDEARRARIRREILMGGKSFREWLGW